MDMYIYVYFYKYVKIQLPIDIRVDEFYMMSVSIRMKKNCLSA